MKNNLLFLIIYFSTLFGSFAFTPDASNPDVAVSNITRHPYTITPLSQVTPIQLQATISNVGAIAVSDAVLTANVFQAPNYTTPIQTLSSTATNIAIGANTSLNVGTFTPSAVGDYMIQYISTCTNNIISSSDTSSYEFSVSNYEYARDNGVFSSAFGIGAGPIGYIASRFTITNTTYLESVLIGLITPASSIGDSTKITIFNSLSGLPNTIIGNSLKYVFTPADTSVLVLSTHAISAIGGGALMLAPGDYFVGVTEYNNTLALAFSDNVFVNNTTFASWTGQPFTAIQNFGPQFAKQPIIRPFLKTCLPSTSTQTFEECLGFSVTVGTNTYTTTGVYTDILTTAAGCDSTVTTNLTINNLSSQNYITTNTEICDSGSSQIVLDNSQVGVHYSLRNDADNSIVDGPIFGNRDSITFNTGTINSTTTYNVYAETPNSAALQFTGNAGLKKVSLGTSIFNDELAGTTNVTVEAWIKRSATGNFHTVVGNYQPGQFSMLFRVSFNKIEFFVNSGANAQSNIDIPVGTWTHVAGVYDGINLKVYVNGNLEGSTPYTLPLDASLHDLTIGGGLSNNTEFFEGDIGEVRLWKVARSASEIAANYQRQLFGNENELLAYYKLNEGSGTKAFNAAANGLYDGTLINTPSWVNGPTITNFSCDLEFSQKSTIVVNNPTTTTDVITACDFITWIDGITYTASNNSAIHTLINAAGCDSVVTLNLTINNLSSQNFSTTNTEICDSGTSQINLNNSEVGVHYFLRNDADNSIVDGPVFGTRNSISLNTGTINSTTTYNVYAETPNSAALQFTGNAGLKKVSLGTSLWNAEFAGNNQLTIETWVKRSTSDNLQTVISNYQTITTTPHEFLFRIDNNKIRLFLNSTLVAQSTSDIPVGTWTHLAATYDGASVKIYVNGVLETTSSFTGNLNSASYDLKIGGGLTNNTEYYSGDIGEVRLWKVARTASDIAANYQKQLFGNENDLVGYYKFNEGSGNIAYNTASNGLYDGTLTNNPAWLSGPSLNILNCDLEFPQKATITVNNPTTATDVITTCDSITWIDGITYTASNNSAIHTLTNAAGCDSIVSLNLTILNFSSQNFTTSQTNVSCNDGSDGSATVSVSGGTAPYTYSWSPSGATTATATGLNPGYNTVTVTDANLCEASHIFTITHPSQLSTSAQSQTNVSCNGGSDGSATVSVSGGSAPYTYSWSPSGGTGATATGLSPGYNTVTVKDANLCEATHVFTITHPSQLSTSAQSQTNVSCNGGSDGSATVSVLGGTHPYTYSWSPSGGTAATATGLTAESYTVTVSDANLCETTQTFTITQPTIINSTSASRCGAGEITISAIPSTGIIEWFTTPSGGTAITSGIDYTISGDSLTINNLSTTTTFYVSASEGPTTNQTGLTDAFPTATTGAGTTNFGIVFDALSEFTLKSVKLYALANLPNTQGTVTIDVVDASGAVLHTATVAVTGNPVAQAVGETVLLNFNIQPGSNLKLRPGARSAEIIGLLFEPSTFAPSGNYGYPFVIPGVLSLNHSTLAAPPTNTPRLDLYYYFFNWDILVNCEATRVPVVATITNNSSSTDTITVCEPYTWIDGITYTANNNTATFTLQNSSGCDSLVTLNLTINNPTTATDVITTCDSITWIDGLTYTASNNSATHTLINAAGCDSVVTLNLTINNLSSQNFSTTNTEICDSGTSQINLNNSEVGVHYFLRNDADNSIVDGPIFGTRNSISLNTGTINSTTTYNVYAETPNSAALQFTGNAGLKKVSLGTSLWNAEFAGNNQLTIETWVKRSTSDNLQTIISNYQTITTTPHEFLFRIDNNKIRLFLNSTLVAQSTSDIPVGTWTHLAATYDGASVKIYVNGVLETTSSFTGNLNSASYDLKIGGGLTNNTEYYSGDIGEVRLWKVARTASDIAANYQKQLFGNENDLVGYYKFNDGSGNIAYNTASNGLYDGTLTNNPAWVSGPSLNILNCDLEFPQKATITVNNPTTATDVITTCDSITWIDGLTYTASNNSATHILTNAAGCDSVVTLDLTITNSNINSTSVSTCNSYTWSENGQTYTTSGTYTNAVGCDVEELVLVIINCVDWLGTEDTDWNNANNWNPIGVPTANDEITILTGVSNYPVVNDLSINNQLIVQNGAALTVSGDLTNNGTITLKSGATLVQTTGSTTAGSGTYNVEQFLKGSGGATPNGRFYYMGTPVTGATTSVFDAANNNRFWTHTEVTGLYTRIQDNATSLTAGGGYTIRMGADDTVVYSSNTLNNGNYTFAGLSNTQARPKAERGIHLWSNPYPSHIDWDLINRTNIDLTYQLRTQNTSTNAMVFDTYNANSGVGTNNNGNGALNKYVAPFQAIWLRVNANIDEGTLALNNSMRSHQNGNVLKSNPDQEIIRLHLSNGSVYDETVIYMHPNANNDLDAFDSQKMMDEHHQLFSVEAGSKLVLNGIENAMAKESVELGIKIDYSGTYSINANELNTMENVVLEDKKENKLQDLKANPRYVFTTTQGEDLNRFVLHFNKTVDQATSNQLAQNTNDEVRIFAFNGNQVKVIIDDKAFENANINVYNMLGALVSSQRAESRENILSLDVATGIYMVELVSKEKVTTQKVMIK
jgi:hypothetical protein